MNSSPRIHDAAAKGFAAGAQVYVLGRPDYPPALERWLREALGLAAGAIALDLGAGTGKFLPRLRATGAKILAVEPVADMRRALTAANPDVIALPGTAEAIPLLDASVDALICAQAFHWFANPKAVGEMRRVLRMGGALGLVWNVRDERAPWVARLTEILDRHQGDAPRFASGAWRAPFPAPGLSDLEETTFAHAHVGSPEEAIVARSMSVSFIAAMDEAGRREVEREVRALIAQTPELAGKDRVVFPYVTRAFRAVRIS